MAGSDAILIRCYTATQESRMPTEIEAIACAIKGYFENHDLETAYTWTFPSPHTWTIKHPRDSTIRSPVVRASQEESPYKQHIRLKEYLSQELWLSDDKTYLDTAYWIVQTWGGIRGFKRNKRNTSLLHELKAAMIAGDHSFFSTHYDRISSLSKVASVYYPQRYAILDSRVAFSLNWLLGIHAPQHKLFIQPPGRNTTLERYDLKTLFHLSGLPFEFYHKGECYTQYCALLQDVKTHLCSMDCPIQHLYEIEMLLFSIAVSPRHATEKSLIMQDIHARVDLTINRD